MAPCSTRACPLATSYCEFSPPSSKDALPELEPSATLAHLGRVDNYLKTVMRHLKELFQILPKIIARVEVSFSVYSSEGSQDCRFEIEVEIRQMKIKPLTKLQALVLLNQGLLQSIFLLQSVSAELERGDIGPEFDENAIEKLRHLKKHLSTLVGFLDRVLMLYSSLCTGVKRPGMKEIKRTAKKLRKSIKELKPSLLKHMLKDNTSICLTEEDILCSVLGLQRHVAAKLKGLFPDVRSHQTDLYFLLRFLEGPGEYSESLRNEDAMASKLQEMGFTENRSVVISKWIAEQRFAEHQSLLAWAQQYVEDLFKYDIFLNDVVPKYPYQEEILNEWFVVSVYRDMDDDDVQEDDGSGNEDSEVKFDVNVVNTTQEEVSRFIEEMAGNFYFHGTDHVGAKSILEDGINLGAGKPQRDFSDGKGFYLSESSEHAIQWAKKSKDAAILVFNIDDSLSSYKCFDLSCAERGEGCKMVRAHYRSGSKISNKSLKKECDHCDYIKAPDSFANSQQTLQQICIKKENMAVSVGNPRSIRAAIFFKT